jgi:Spy/CpxP family protein refolding chaperone
MKRPSIGLCSLVLGCGLAFAQSPPAPPTPAQHAAHEVSMLTQMLSLTADQQKQVTSILTTAASTESNLRTSMDAAHKALQTAIQSNDSAAIATAAEQIGDLTRQQVQAKATADAAIYALLTPDQQSKFKIFASHGPHGRGGFGPPPGGPPGE